MNCIHNGSLLSIIPNHFSSIEHSFYILKLRIKLTIVIISFTGLVHPMKIVNENCQQSGIGVERIAHSLFSILIN